MRVPMPWYCRTRGSLLLLCLASCSPSLGPEPVGPPPGPLPPLSPASPSLAPDPELVSVDPKIAALARELPPPSRWREHLEAELMPFWTHPDALGNPVGNFPTFRCNDGSAYRADAPCPELSQPRWIQSELGADYTRMKSRQIFAYGVAFHVTGDPRYLAYARAGVNHLRAHALDAQGSAITRFRQGKPEPEPAQRTSQDLAYAQLGMAFYYYLTRDPEVLADLIRVKHHIFATYFEPAWKREGTSGMLRWVPAGGGPEAEAKELVAQLDQINAYLLLLAPLLPRAQADEWRRDLANLAAGIAGEFFAADHGMFWGAVHSPERMALGTHHTDFGHSAKALWMLYLTGRLVGDKAQSALAETHAQALMDRAQSPDTGCWGSGLAADGTVHRGSSWWTSAELDQLAATLALSESRYIPYLRRGYDCWLTRFVDREHGEVWPFLPPSGAFSADMAVKPAKMFHWKNGYHSTEHALIAFITTGAMLGEPVPLYFAFHTVPEDNAIRPYLFQGAIAKKEPVALSDMQGMTGMRVVFTGIRP